MAWSIDRGSYEGVSLAGLKVVVVTTASDTLGFGGTLVVHPEQIRSVMIVDRSASSRQRDALVQFATEHATHAGEIVKVVELRILLLRCETLQPSCWSCSLRSFRAELFS